MRYKKILVGVLILVTGIWYYQLTLVYGFTTSSFEVEKIVDGDTFVVVSGEKFRLKGINTPEKKMPYYDEATDFLRGKVQGRVVGVENHGVDKYGRFLVHVFDGGENINEEILELGLGSLYYYEKDSHYSELKKAEEKAREEGLGIWKRSSNYGCLELVELRFEEEGGRCIEGELLRIENSCDYDIEVILKDDATHIYDEVILAKSIFEKSFSCIFNDAGDSLYVWDEEGLLMFYRY